MLVCVRVFRRRSPVLFLGCLAIVLAYAVCQSGGVASEDWNFCLLALGLMAFVYWLRTPRTELAPRLSGSLWWPILLLLCYTGSQFIPLPLRVLRILSPNRAELVGALAPAVPKVGFASLSVIPAVSFAHFLRICAYTVIFLLIREIAWRLPNRPWLPALPVVIIASLEAAVGLSQWAAGGFVHGTYVDRDHFAGLLEMSLPFAVMYPVAILHCAEDRHLSTSLAWKVSAGMALAALMFAAITVSLSRMGFVASLCSLFILGVLTLRAARLSRPKKLAAVGLVLSAVLASFLYLPSEQLIARFAYMAQEAEDRPLLWRETLNLIRAYPVFGCGLGGYESAFLKFKVSTPLVSDDVAHNDYLQFLAELGLIGFTIAAALMTAIIVHAIRYSGRNWERERQCLGIACTGALAAILIHSIVDFNLYIPANAMLLAWISGITASLGLTSQR